MKDPFRIGAGVRELLGELASDSTARLLRITEGQARVEARERAPFVRSGMPSLTQVERKLLDCHREEVARVLYRYSVLVACRLPAVRDRQHYADNSPLPSEDVLATRAEHCLSSTYAQHEDLTVLEECLGGPSMSPLSILAAGARFAPSAEIRIAQASNLLHVESDHRRAGEVFSDLAREQYLLSYALEGLGGVAAEQGDFEQAARTYRLASEADPLRPMPKLAWLRFSVRCGAIADIEASASVVDATLSVSDPAVRWYLGLPGEGDPGQIGSDPVRVPGIPDERFGMITRAVIHGS